MRETMRATPLRATTQTARRTATGRLAAVKEPEDRAYSYKVDSALEKKSAGQTKPRIASASPRVNETNVRGQKCTSATEAQPPAPRLPGCRRKHQVRTTEAGKRGRENEPGKRPETHTSQAKGSSTPGDAKRSQSAQVGRKA